MNGGHAAPPAGSEGAAGRRAPSIGRVDFFVSYTAVDRTWAEWIAWQLEAAGFQVLIQAWDFVPGSHWMTKMADGVSGCDRVIAVLSYAYLDSVYGQAEWQAAFRADPKGDLRKVIPIRVEDCPRPVLLEGVVSFDLFDLSAEQARAGLLEHIRHALRGRAKPVTEPHFPGVIIPPAPAEFITRHRPQFPGEQVVPGPHPSTGTATAPSAAGEDTGPRRPLRSSPPQRATSPPPQTAPFSAVLGTKIQVAESSARVSQPARRSHRRPVALATSLAVVLAVVITTIVFTRSDGHGVPPATRLGQALTGAAGAVQSVVFSANGHVLAAASFDGHVQLWDVADPTNPKTIGEPLTGPTGPVESVAISPDGRTLAAGAAEGNNGRDGRVWLFDISDTANPKATELSGFGGVVWSVAFSKDGHTLAAASSAGVSVGAVRLWDVGNPAKPIPLGQPLGPINGVYSVAFSADGRTLASGGEGGVVQLWHVSSPVDPPKTIGQPLSGPASAVHAVVFAPKGRLLAAADSSHGAVWLWDVSDPSAPRTMSHLTANISPGASIALSPDGQTLVVGGQSGVVELWNISDPSRPKRLGEIKNKNMSWALSLAFARDNHTLAVGAGGDRIPGAASTFPVNLWRTS